MALETRPTTDNYLKSLAPLVAADQSLAGQNLDARYEFFYSGAPAHLERAAQWARREVNAGRRVSVYRRIEGLEDLLEVGEFDPADLLEPN